MSGAGHNLPPAPSAMALATLARAAEASAGLAAIIERAWNGQAQAVAQAHKKRAFGRGSSTWSPADERRLAAIGDGYLARHARDIGARLAKIERQARAIGTIEVELAPAEVEAQMRAVELTIAQARRALDRLDGRPTS